MKAYRLPLIVSSLLLIAALTACSPSSASTPTASTPSVNTGGTVASTTQLPTSGSTATIPGTLGISLNTVELLMGGPGAVYTFSEGVSGGQPETVAKLVGNDPSISQAMVSDFMTELIGDPSNLSQVKITVPLSDPNSMNTLDILTKTVLPGNENPQFTPWLDQTYPTLAAGAKQQTTISTYLFTLSCTQTDVILEIDPAK